MFYFHEFIFNNVETVRAPSLQELINYQNPNMPSPSLRLIAFCLKSAFPSGL